MNNRRWKSGWNFSTLCSRLKSYLMFIIISNMKKTAFQNAKNKKSLPGGDSFSVE
jgi:hypothetical protein